LRKLVVGKEVMFQVEATSPNGREFGSVRLSSPVHGETDVTTIMVSNGWLKVKIDTKNNTGE
jgi:endonuclease YncB( thermonuclease family)